MAMDIENLESQKKVTSNSRGLLKSLSLRLRWRPFRTPAPHHNMNMDDETSSSRTQVFSSENITNNNHHEVKDYIHLQLESIKKIIKEKDFNSLQQFGGASTLAEALGSDTENGISSDDQHLCCRRITPKSSNFQAPEKGLVRQLLGSLNNYIIILLLVAGIVSVGFGMKEKGPKTGWLVGAFVLIVPAVMLILPLIRDAMGFQRKPEGIRDESGAEAAVIRGGIRENISVSDVLLGDIVRLTRGCQIPADGLFVSGDSLKLDDGEAALINAANPFLFYGAEVVRGEARMLVTSTGGEDTLWADAIKDAAGIRRAMSFESRLDKVNTWKQIVGLLISVLMIVIQFLQFEFVKDHVKQEIVQQIVSEPSTKIALMTSLSMLLVAVVGGFPLYLTLAIGYRTRKGLACSRELSAWVAMGSVTVVITDLVGGLALEPLQVEKFFIGKEKMAEDLIVHPNVRDALCEGITTPLLLPHAFITETDEPILSWAVPKFCLELETVRNGTKMVRANEWTDSEGRVVLIMKNNDSDNRKMSFHYRGLATKILPGCSFYYNREGSLMEMDEQNVSAFQEIIEHMQRSEKMKVIAFAYKRANAITFVETGPMILLGLAGLNRRICEETRHSIRTCLLAGVRIVLVSPDDAKNLARIAQEFGLLTRGKDLIIRGKEFRELNDGGKMEVVSQVSVMGNSLPSDRNQLVELLKKSGESVAVIGKSTNDVLALKAADVGLVMGIRSNHVARASADIVSWGTDIGFLLPIVRYGRGIRSNIQNYVRHELTMLSAGLLIALITTASTGEMALTTVESGWVSLVVPVLIGATHLIENLSEENSIERNEAVITKAMWVNIVTQAMSQTLVVLVFVFKGEAIFSLETKVRKTITFNSFVLCQVFSQLNGRDRFKNIHKKYWLLLSVGIILVLQEIFIEIAHVTFHNARLNLPHWGISFMIGMVALAMDWVGSVIFGFIIKVKHLLQRKPSVKVLLMA